MAPGRRVPPLQPGDRVQAAARDAQRPVQDFQGVHAARRHAEPEPRHAARAVPAETGGAARADRRGRVSREPLQALLDRRDVLRLHQPGSARDAGDRDEPPRRQVEHGRGRRGSRALHPARQRRLEAQRHQAGGVGTLRRDQRVPGERRRPADQDGAGRKAGRGRPAAGTQGVPVDREDAVFDAWRRVDLAAAAPRHLLDRGPRAAHLRPEELEPAGAHPREARRRGRRGDGGGRRGQGALRRRADLRPRRRHRRVAADQPQARRAAVGARPRRDATGARPQQAARPDRRPGGRPDEDGARRGHRRAARGRGVWFRDGAAGRDGLRDDARLSPEHLPGRALRRRTRSCARSSRARPSSSRTSSVSSRRKCAS